VKFEDLINEVKSSKKVDDNNLQRWEEIFNKTWRDEDDCWEKLISLLPFPYGDIEFYNIDSFKEMIAINKKYISLPTIIFLTTVSLSKLSDRYWTNEFGSKAFEFIAGNINLYNYVSSSRSKYLKGMTSRLQDTINYFFCVYPLLILSLSIKYPEIITKQNDAFYIAGKIRISFSKLKYRLLLDRYEIENLVRYFSSISGESESLAKTLKEIFGHDKRSLCQLLNKALSNDIRLPYTEIIPILLTRDNDFDWRDNFEEFVLTALNKQNFMTDKNLLAIIDHYPFDSQRISQNFNEKLKISNFVTKEEKLLFFQLWAGFLTPSHGYDFYWFAFNEEGNIFGTQLDERLENISNQIIKHQFHRIKGKRNDHDDEYKKWKLWKKLFRPLGSLFEIQNSYRYGREAETREEIWVRQTEAIEILTDNPECADWVIRGILDYSQKYWDLLDPIILGLSEKITVETLNNYLQIDHPHEIYYHTRRILSHATNKIPFKNTSETNIDEGLLSCIEDLFAYSKSNLKIEKARTWIGEPAIETLAFGTIEKANTDFNEYYDSQFGQDEHEHVAVLIEKLHQNFERLSKVIANWLTNKYAIPAAFHTSIKRFPKRAPEGYPQEGGAKGYQADLAVILNCDIPELMLTDRITFFQAKKISQNEKLKTWENAVSINQDQLEKALNISAHFYYLFFLHSEIGKSPVVLPAQMVKDICKSGTVNKISVPLILRASREFPLFFLNDLIGLWIGDSRLDLINEVKKGRDRGQGPRVLLEVHISRKQQE
jgi:hypothetical protein